MEEKRTDIFAKIREIDSLALKKFGRLTPKKYAKRLREEIDELLKACDSVDPTDIIFELFDVIAFTYAYFVNGLGFPHKHFESLLLEKALLVKDRFKVPVEVELCPNPEIPCDCCPRGESVNCPLEKEGES